MTAIFRPSVVRRAFRPPPKVSVSDWAERCVVIPSGKSSRPGPLRLSWTPYFVEPLDAMGDDHTEKVVLMTCTQVGKTTLQMLTTLYYLDQDPSEIMVISPRNNDAAELCQRRLKPLLEASPKLRHLIPEAKSGYVKQVIATGNATAYFVGAGSAASLLQRSCRILLPDEVDAYLPYLRGAPDPVSILTERAKTFHDRKILMASTPGISEGLIYREYLTGDQRAYHCPCPKCGLFQVLEFDNLKYPNAEECGADGQAQHAATVGVQGLAYLECKGCKAELREGSKGPMLEAGVWVPEGATVDAAGKVKGAKNLPVRSYHLSTMCSRWVTWSEMAAKFIEAKGSQERLRSFTNNWQGRPWESRIRAASVSSIIEKAKDYERGSLPEGVEILTAGVDVQGARGQQWMAWVIRGWGYNQESWLIDYGRTESWDEIDKIMFHTQYGEQKKSVSLTCIDAGYDTPTVYEFCRTRQGLSRPIKGVRTRAGAPISNRRPVDMTKLGKRSRVGLSFWVVDTTYWKDHLIDRQTNELSGWWVFEAVDQEYLREISAEHKVLERDGSEVWKKKSEGRANHFGDCEVYALVAAQMRGVYAMKAPSDKATETTPKPEQVEHPDIEYPHLRRKPYGRRDGNGRKRAW